MHVMIDLETLSLRPDAHVLEIGAVPFDSEGVYHVQAFNAYCGEQRRHIDFQTLAWWLSDDMEKGAGIVARQRIAEGLKHASPLHQVLLAFGSWFSRFGEVEGVWCRGASFDLAILRHAYLTADFGAGNSGFSGTPWGHRAERCSRTAIAGSWLASVSDDHSFIYENATEKLLGCRFVKHAALHDAVAEAFHVRQILPVKRS